MRKRTIALLLAMTLVINLTACAESATETSTLDSAGNDNTEISASTIKPTDNHFVDNDLLYADDDDTSVITMYLTVSKGTSSENTNHTWEEINSYSVYDYEEMGVERYAVSGLLQVGDENGPLEGELGYGKYSPNAVVTIRGQSSSLSPQKNYKIKLNENAGTWNDQQTINLNKHVYEGLRFRNKLAYDLLEELPGMMALQTQFVHLYVKDETEGVNAAFVDYGLYTQVEQPNKSFLQRHGLDKNGHLYKINEFEFYRYEDTIKLKNEIGYDITAFEERVEIKGDDDHSKLIAMLDAVNDYSIAIDEVLEEWFDVDNLASWMAFHILLGNIDTQSRNVLLYSPLNVNKWYFISWDNDGSLRRTEYRVQDKNKDGWSYGVSNYWGNVLFQRALKSENFQGVLNQKIELFREILTEEKMNDLVQSYANVVKPYVYSEADILYAPLTSAEYDVVCKGVIKEIEENYQLYKKSLEQPMPFFIGVPESTEEGLKFTWDVSYDFDNENVFYSFELADNFEFKNPIVLETDIFVPGYTFEGELEPGQYFVRVKSRNESGEEQLAFDSYVSNAGDEVYSTRSFYVMQDGSIEVWVYGE